MTNDLREVHSFGERQRPFEHVYGLGQRPLAQEEMANSATHPDKTVGVIDRLGQPEGVLGVGPSLGKRAQLRKAPGHLRTGDHRLHICGPKALAEQRPVQDLDVPPERLRRLPIVVQDPQVEFAQEAVGGDLQADVPQGCANGQRALGGRQSFVNVALNAADTPTDSRRDVPAGADHRAPRQGVPPGAGGRGSAHPRGRDAAHCAGRSGDR